MQYLAFARALDLFSPFIAMLDEDEGIGGDLTVLPPELLVLILSKLNLRDILAVTRVRLPLPPRIIRAHLFVCRYVASCIILFDARLPFNIPSNLLLVVCSIIPKA